ncbi:MAG: LPS export ABC transporter permease LptF [Proteobacteria bacterium]|nr:LPS export ABC transporter permease LptF [Pseudomonadota bacterium]
MEANWPKGYKMARRPLISVLDRMIALDLLKTLLSVWTVIVVIVVSRKFIRILDKAVEGHVSSDTLLTILGLKTVTSSISLLPAATFMALLMVLGRLYKDQEMSAIATAGGGAGTIYRAVFLLVFPLSITSLGLSVFVSPWAENRTQEIMHQDEQTSGIRGIAAGKFSEYSRGDLVFYVENITSENKMHSVFVRTRKENKSSTISAELGHFEELPGGRYMFFENGERIQGKPGDFDYTIEKFKEYAVKIEESTLPLSATLKAASSDTLWKSKGTREIAELQGRLAVPLGVLLLGFIAAPLSRISPRGGIYGSMLMGFLIYFSYGNLSGVAQSWVIKGSIPTWPGMFWVNLLLFFIGLLLLANWYGFRWLILTIKQKVSK